MKRTLLLGEEDLEECERKITASINKTVKDSGADGVVLGVSGGVDSALVLSLAARSDVDVRALIMPENEMTTRTDIMDAKNLAEGLNVRYNVIEIKPVLKTIEETFPWEDFSTEYRKTATGNCKARIRMIYNYLVANLENRLVLGTGNRTEILLGYATKYGDGGVDVLPIGDLYKTHVRQLANYLQVPARIVKKVPTAGLWEGQTDEGELGASYDDIDNVLFCLVDRNMSVDAAAAEAGVSRDVVAALKARMEKSTHKRQMPPITKLFD